MPNISTSRAQTADAFHFIFKQLIFYHTPFFVNQNNDFDQNEYCQLTVLPLKGTTDSSERRKRNDITFYKYLFKCTLHHKGKLL